MSTNTKLPVEQRKDRRCDSTDKEPDRPGRTHECKLTRGHEGECACICDRTWKAREAA